MAHTTVVTGILLAAAACFSIWHLAATSARTADATMGLTVSSGGTCSANECTVPLSATFTLDIEVLAAPAEGYHGIQTELSYGNFLSHGGRYDPSASPISEFVWPPTVLGIRSIGSNGVVNHTGTSAFAPPYETSHHEGPIIRLTMRCSNQASTSTLSLIPYAPDNGNATAFTNAPPPHVAAKSSPLTIICGKAPSTPIATSTSGPPTNTPVPPTTATPAPTATHGATPQPPMGDASCDGIVNAIDAALILQFGAGLVGSLSCQQAADVNGDGRINAVDAAIVLQSTL